MVRPLSPEHAPTKDQKMRRYNDSPIGRRVVAWRGERELQHGTITRVDGIYHVYVRWDDGEETHYEASALTRPKFVQHNTPRS